MQTSPYLFCLLVLFAFCLSPIAGERYAVQRRQDNGGSPTSNTKTAAATSSNQAASSGSAPSSVETSTKATAAASSGASPSSTSSAAASTSSDHAVSSSSSSAATTGAASATSSSPTGVPSNGTRIDKPDPLPIHPKITPALGIVGVILIGSGIVYALIGIKNSWLYIFFSTAYLTSLACTVLILYVMNPPVTNAVQGAFFVAAFLTGLIFGALSLIFTEVTDGLGCMLGGFCLSMWFLTLKEGGLITSATGRAIFIGAFSFAAFSLSFSHYTRTHGLIICTAFGGAMITTLGIDCFSRAGMKEFWLYIWNLNPNIFPIGTNGYPITRGIRVESACTVIIFLFGLVSQFKLWKFVKERREKAAAHRLEQEENLDRLDSAAGRRIENNIARERAEWEAKYGNKEAATMVDSVDDSTNSTIPKSSVSVREVNRAGSDEMELVEMGRGATSSQNSFTSKRASQDNAHGKVTVQVADDEIRQINEYGNAISTPPPVSRANSTQRHSTAGGSGRSSSELRPGEIGHQPSLSPRESLRASVPPPPPVIPLPFTIPKAEEDEDREENASLSTVPESVHEAAKPRGYMTGSRRKRISGGARSSRDFAESQEALVIPHYEDDRASSVAATFDELDEDDMSLPEISPPASPLDGTFGDRTPMSSLVEQSSKEQLAEDGQEIANSEGKKAMQTEKDPNSKESSNDHANRDQASKDAPANEKSIKLAASAAAMRQSLTISTDPKPVEDKEKEKENPTTPRTKGKRVSRGSIKRHSGASTVNGDETRSRPRAKSSKSARQSEAGQSESQVTSLGEHLPEGLSKVVLSYRTNEWAKHLEAADKPEVDDLELPSTPGGNVVDDMPDEPATSVSIAVKSAEGSPQGMPQQAGAIKAAPFPTNLQRDLSQSSQNNPYLKVTPTRSASSLSKHTNQEVPQPVISRNPSNATLPGVSTTNLANSSQVNVNRSTSLAKLGSRSNRNSSTPLVNQPLVESPMEEANAMRYAPQPHPGNTLLGQRENLVRNKVGTMSFAPYASNPNLVSGAIGPNDSSSVRNLDVNPSASQPHLTISPAPVDTENMTLAERKAYIQAQQKNKNGTWPLPEQFAAAAQPGGPAGFDSHQPKRGSGIDQGKREAMLANWRESVRHDLDAPPQIAGDAPRRAAATANDPRTQSRLQGRRQEHMLATWRDSVRQDLNGPQGGMFGVDSNGADEMRRQQMLQQRERDRQEAMRKEQERNIRDVVFDNAMRRGDMLDLHKEAMRRMQANANKNAGASK